jgi:hypothetical protein
LDKSTGFHLNVHRNKLDDLDNLDNLDRSNKASESNVYHNTLDNLDDLDGFNSSNKASRSYSHLHLNTTSRPHPHSNDHLNRTPPFTPYSNNNDTRFNIDNVFRSNTPNMLHSNTSPFTNDSSVRSTFQTLNNTGSTLGPFHKMDNVHQICSWLCANPSILLLAYNMHLSMQTPVANSFSFVSPNFNSSMLTTGIPQMSNQGDKVKNLDFLEELKCLFLRVRNPKRSVFEDLVRIIFNCRLNSTEGTNWLTAAKNSFTDSRNKFLNAVEQEIDNFKAKR